MNPKPKIELTLSTLDRSLELFSNILLIVMWLLTIFVFIKSPTIIPTHFNASGVPNDYGNKNSMLLLPVIATFIFFVITWLNKYPHLLNYGTTITVDSARKQYAQATTLLRFLKLGILIIFTLLILLTYLTSTGTISNLGNWFLPTLIVLMLVPVAIPIIISLKIKG